MADLGAGEVADFRFEALDVLDLGLLLIAHFDQQRLLVGKRRMLRFDQLPELGGAHVIGNGDQIGRNAAALQHLENCLHVALGELQIMVDRPLAKIDDPILLRGESAAGERVVEAAHTVHGEEVDRAVMRLGVSDHIGRELIVALAVDIDQRQLALNSAFDDVQQRHRLAAAGGAQHQRMMLGVLVGQMNRRAVLLIDADQAAVLDRRRRQIGAVAVDPRLQADRALLRGLAARHLLQRALGEERPSGPVDAARGNAKRAEERPGGSMPDHVAEQREQALGIPAKAVEQIGAIDLGHLLQGLGQPAVASPNEQAEPRRHRPRSACRRSIPGRTAWPRRTRSKRQPVPLARAWPWSREARGQP